MSGQDEEKGKRRTLLRRRLEAGDEDATHIDLHTSRRLLQRIVSVHRFEKRHFGKRTLLNHAYGEETVLCDHGSGL